MKVTYAESDGRELMLAVRGPGDVLGEFAGRDGQERSATVRSLEPAITSRLPDERFNELVRRFGLDVPLRRYIMGKLRDSAAHAWQVAHRPASAKLAELLLAIVDASGSDHPAPRTVPMSQDDLASSLGVARSAITPVIAEWKSAGLVRVGRAKVEVRDRAAIAAVAADSSRQ